MAYIHITMAGNIGAGKSTWTDYLTRGKGKEILKRIFEKPVKSFEELNYTNHILPAFYEALATKNKRVIYESELEFLRARRKMDVDIRNYDGIAVSDRSIYEDREIFVRALKGQGLLVGGELLDYLHKYRMALRTTKPPDLLIFLEVDEPKILMERIKKRSRDVESGIRLRYLIQLNRFYRFFITNYPYPVIPLNAAEDCPKIQDNPAESRYFEYNTDLVVRELKRQGMKIMQEKNKNLFLQVNYAG